jgi:hypothetical protein
MELGNGKAFSEFMKRSTSEYILKIKSKYFIIGRKTPAELPVGAGPLFLREEAEPWGSVCPYCIQIGRALNGRLAYWKNVNLSSQQKMRFQHKRGKIAHIEHQDFPTRNKRVLQSSGDFSLGL